MGKSDPYIFPEYKKMLQGLSYSSVAFLGFSSENDLTNAIKSPVRHFYDRELKNWEINSDWTLQQKYDLIVCTRCAYFSKNPKNFIEKCKTHLSDNGSALVDWGLGDHWRFEKYKVGWVRNEEHEYAYDSQNFLYSCFWNDSLKHNPLVNEYWQAVVKNNKYGYSKSDQIDDIIISEIPEIIDYNYKKISFKNLWLEENPQLYIITLI
jgi:hypothetical protein